MTRSVKDSLHGSEYGKAYVAGISAVKKEYRSRIKVKNPRNLAGSMDVDTACRKAEPAVQKLRLSRNTASNWHWQAYRFQEE